MNMKTKNTLISSGLAIIIASSVASTSVQADTIGVYLGGQVFNSNARGLFGEKNQQIDFNLDTKKQGSFFIAIEHPLPFIPNLKISSMKLDTKGKTTLNSDFTYGGTTFPSDSAATTDFKTDYIDYTAYYELFDNDLITFDLGLTVRDISADVMVSGTSATTPPVSSTAKISASTYVPLAYVATNIGIPSTDFNIYGEGNFLSVNGQTLYDYQVGVSYELVDNIAVGVNLTAGYRNIKFQLKDVDNLYTDLTFSGVFAGAVVHF